MAHQVPFPDQPPEWPGYELRTARLRQYVRHEPRGHGGPPLLLLHGYGVHGGMYEGGMRRELQDRFDLIVPDLRGHGQTESPQTGWTIEEFADDIAALLDTLEIERAHIVGYSLGGFVALALADRHPDRIDHLGLLCTAPRQARLRMRGGLAALQALFRVVPPGVMLQITKRMLAGPDMPPEMNYVLPWLLGSNTRKGLSGTAKALRQADLREAVGRIRHPALLVTAEHDAALPRSAWEPLLEIPGLRHEHFEDAGHGLAASHGLVLAGLLREFLPG